MLYATLIAAFAYAVHWYRFKGFQSPPDSAQYYLLGSGAKADVPYSRRWFLPTLLRRNTHAWIVVTALSFVACGPLLYALTGSLACVWLFVWLPGIAFNVRCPVLVDQFAMALMLLAVVLAQHDQLFAAGVVIALCGQVKESAPVFGVILAPVLWPFALGSTVLAVLIGKIAGTTSENPKVAKPLLSAWRKHDPLNWRDMLLPWGCVLPLAVFAPLSLAAVVALVCGYGQLLIAQDRARLYQWAAPAVLVAVGGLSPLWLPLALAAHPFVCAQGKGA